VACFEWCLFHFIRSIGDWRIRAAAIIILLELSAFLQCKALVSLMRLCQLSNLFELHLNFLVQHINLCVENFLLIFHSITHLPFDCEMLSFPFRDLNVRRSGVSRGGIIISNLLNFWGVFWWVLCLVIIIVAERKEKITVGWFIQQ
jgi:hypothetical protein